MSVYCRSGKRGYPTEAEAAEALTVVVAEGVVDRARGSRRRRERRVYLCTTWCGAWHLTSKPKAA